MQGIAALIAMNIVETEKGYGNLEWGSSDRIHIGVEAMRLAFADALAYDADPEVVSSIPVWSCHVQNKICLPLEQARSFVICCFIKGTD